LRPCRDVGGMVFTDLGCEFQVWAKESGAKFCDEFHRRRNLHRPKSSGQNRARCGTDASSSACYADVGIMGSLVRDGCIEALCVPGALDRRQLDVVTS